MSLTRRILSRHPLDFIPPGWWPSFFWPLLGLNLLVIIVFLITGAPLTTEEAPYGVVSFEIAGTVANAQQILDSWDADAKLRASFGLGFDYLFMSLYAFAIAFGCGMAARSLERKAWPLFSLGNFLAWGAILAALLDIVENIALTTLIFGTVASPWPEIARWCAIPKLVLIFIGVVYLFYGGTVALLERLSPAEQE